jgi:hypothetical protein
MVFVRLTLQTGLVDPLYCYLHHFSNAICTSERQRGAVEERLFVHNVNYYADAG